MKKRILLYVPNIIDYVRIFLLILAWILADSNWCFIILYTISALLDEVDGYTARLFGQQSAFGAWLDVVVDNISRGLLWSQVNPNFWFISAIEWITFVCNYKQGGNTWKEFKDPPNFVKKVMSQGLKTPPGWFAVGGLHVLPIWMYIIKHNMLQMYIPSYVVTLQYTILGILIIGRLLCMSVEVWCIHSHIHTLLDEVTKE